MPTYPLEIRLFGTMEVSVQGAPLPPLRTRKGLALLAFLTLRRGGEIERAVVAEYLWPDSLPSIARDNLQTTVKDLRRALGPEAHRLFTPRYHWIALDLTGCFVDTRDFENRLCSASSDDWKAALDLYARPLLEGWGMRDGEDWVLAERDTRRESLDQAVDRLLLGHLHAGGLSPCLALLNRHALHGEPQQVHWRRLLAHCAEQSNYAGFHQVYQQLERHLTRYASPLDPETERLRHALPLAHRLPPRRKRKASPVAPSLNLPQEPGNYEAALTWALSADTAPLDTEVGLRLVHALVYYWESKGLLAEGRRWIRQALAKSEGHPSPLRATLLAQAASMVKFWSAPEEAVRMAEESLAFWSESNDKRGMARAFYGLGQAKINSGCPSEALCRFQESLALWQEIGDEREGALVLRHIANCHLFQGDIARGEALYDRLLQTSRRLQDTRQQLDLLRDMANRAINREEFVRVTELLEEGERLTIACDDRFYQAQFQVVRATMARDQGRLDEAEQGYRRALALFEQENLPLHRNGMLGMLGHVARKRGDLSAALQYLTEALEQQRLHSSGVDLGDALCSLGYLHLDRGDYPAARACFEESGTIYRRIGFQEGIARNTLDLADLALREGVAFVDTAALQEAHRHYQATGDQRVLRKAERLLRDCALPV